MRRAKSEGEQPNGEGPPPPPPLDFGEWHRLLAAQQLKNRRPRICHQIVENEMEESAVPASTTTAVATIENGDPDSRDSGISIGALSLASANDNSSSPLKKRQRQSSGGGRLQCPTDFSFLHQNQLSAANTSSVSLFKLTDNELPQSVRPVQRVHSTCVLQMLPTTHSSIQRANSSSVLELANQSLGSPDVFEHYSLVTVDRPQVPSRAFRSIGANTVVQLLESMTAEQFNKKFVLIDCRYPYEFTGGHIRYSENIFQSEDVIKLFYPDDEKLFQEVCQRIPIFYCEFSQKRGPKMAMALREHDRMLNENRYPYVDYKEIYLLDRGYRQFFKEEQLMKFCEPQAYIQMWDPIFAEERKRFDGHRRNPKRRRVVSNFQNSTSSHLKT